MPDTFPRDSPSPDTKNQESFGPETSRTFADGSSENQPLQVWSDKPWLVKGAYWTRASGHFSCQDPSGRWVIDLDLTRRSDWDDVWPEPPPRGLQFGAYSAHWGPFSRTTISQDQIDSELIKDDSFLAESYALAEYEDHRRNRRVLWAGAATCDHWYRTKSAQSRTTTKLRIDISLPINTVNCPLCRMIEHILLMWHNDHATNGYSNVKPANVLGSKSHQGQTSRGPSLIASASCGKLSDPAGYIGLSSTSDHLTLELQPGPPVFDLLKGGKFLAKIKQSFYTDENLCANELSPGLHGLDGQINMEIVARLVRHCCTSHAVCNANAIGSRSIETLLLNVKTLRLVHRQTTERYFALSYVWGGVQSPDTRLSNIRQLKKHGVRHLFGKLPEVIEDAITLTKACGERYLWVDKLCIIQDDAERKHNQIMQMDTIFSSAALTIVAFSGRDVNCPLPGLRPNSRPPIRLVGCGGNNRLILDPKSPKAIIESAFYETRGWTYQERILSRRCLYLSDSQALFQCREGCLPEAMWTTRDQSNIPRLRATENTPDTFDFLNPMSKMWQSTVSGFAPPEEFWKAYTQLVRQYSSRSLSYNVDILHAFAGIIAAFYRHIHAHFIQGLPLRFADHALFWYQRVQIRRRCTGGGTLQSSTAQFSSWSWAGWVGPVSYLQTSVGQASYTRSDIESFTLIHKDICQLSGEAQNSTDAPQYRYWTPLRVASAVLHDSHKYILKFSAKSFVTSLLKFDFNSLLAKDELPVSKILDTKSQQCGILFDGGEIGTQLQGASLSLPDFDKFIILSYTKRALSRRGGFTHYSDDGYLEPFGEEYSMLPGAWRCVNVMLIRARGDSYERVAVGMLHEKMLSKFAINVETIQLI